MFKGPRDLMNVFLLIFTTFLTFFKVKSKLKNSRDLCSLQGMLILFYARSNFDFGLFEQNGIIPDK